jgi:hypothetical protein
MPPCTSDLSCPASLICYSNVTWIASYQSAPFDNQTNCLCSTWWGRYDAPGCASTSPAPTAFWFATCVLLATCFYAATLHALYEIRALAKGRGLSWDITTTSLLQVLSADLLFGTSQVLILCSFTASAGSDTYIVQSQKTSRTLRASQFLFVLAILMAALASVTISLLWIQFAERTRRLQKSGRHLHPVLARTAFAFECAFGATIVAFCALGNMPLAQLASIPYGVIILSCYLVGNVRMNSTLNVAHRAQARPEFISMLRAIRVATVFISLSLLGAISVGVCYGALSLSVGWKEQTPPGAVSSIVALSQASPFCFLVGVVAVQYYLRSCRVLVRKPLLAAQAETGAAANGKVDPEQESQPGSEPRALPSEPAQAAAAATTTHVHTLRKLYEEKLIMT